MTDEDATLVEPPDPRRSVIAALRETAELDATVIALRGAPPPPAGDTRALGRYPLLGSLGAGGMGEVLEALDPDLGRRIAAKVMRGGAGAAALRKFVQEAQVTGQLDHPNIVPVYELGLDAQGRVYFTMKKVRGQDLASVLAEAREQSLQAVRESGVHGVSRRRRAVSSGRLEAVREPTGAEPWWRLVPILVKVCDGIEFAHARGVIHRDLKPANVMVGAFGEVQVMDWGLAKILDAPEADGAAEALTLDLGGGSIAELARQGSEAPLVTLDGQVAGTPQYMPPEQARGEIEALDERTDIYALGALLYEMLAMRPPYTGENVWNVLLQVMEGELAPPSQTAPRHLRERIPWELERIVQRAMAPEQADRYPTAGAMREDLERFLTGQAVAAARYTPWQLLKKWAARNRAAVAAAASIAAVVVIATMVAFALVTRQKNRALAAQQREATQRKKAEASEAKAKSSEAKAKASEQTARASEARAKASKADFDRLADVQHLRELTAGAEALWPRRPRLIPRYEGWLTRARKLAGHQREHEETVARLKAEPELDAAKQVLLGALQQLVTDLKALRADDRYGNTIAGVRWRLAFAMRLRAREDRDRAAWGKAIAAIRRAPVYRGLVVKRVPGLVPLGPDPDTTLWEFAHLGTGKPAVRGEDGKLQLTDDTGLVLVLLPRGSFSMGASRTGGPNKDPQAQGDERPVRVVRLTAFYLGKHEMTQGQWLRATGDNPSVYKAGKRYGPKLATLRNPVTNVGWNQCNLWMKRLGLQLPTEAQWEYAARAGTHSVWPYGDKLADLQGKANIADAVAKRYAPAWGAFNPELNDGHVVHAPVGSFPANRWGLHDVTGNVWEWCRDRYGAYKLGVRPGDGLRRVPSAARLRVSRGGSFAYTATDARSANRYGDGPAFRDITLGLRPALGTTR